MLPAINNILYLTDLSKNSAYVFRYALQLAQKFEAKITILHVVKRIDAAMEVPILIQLGEDAYHNLVKEKEQDIIEQLKQRLRVFVEKELGGSFREDDRVSAIKVREGEPVVEILEAAEKFDIDLLVMGDHSKGVLAHTFLGSTTERVLRHIRKPVFVVPLPKKGLVDDAM